LPTISPISAPPGIKRDRANFATLAYQDSRIAGQQSSNETQYATGLNLGTGVSVQSTTSITTQGTLSTTGNALDFALDGDGYFQVQLPGGKLGYTRAGNFSRSAEGQLVTAQGYPVQPAIAIPEGCRLNHRGPGWHRFGHHVGQPNADRAWPDHRCQLCQFGGPASAGRQLPAETAASGPAQIGAPGDGGRGSIKQGMLEASNVNVVEELVDMIECQRAYEINSKMISSVDEMLRNANQTL
jgi:flagellar basal-body rod protein FlgG